MLVGFDAETLRDVRASQRQRRLLMRFRSLVTATPSMPVRAPNLQRYAEWLAVSGDIGRSLDRRELPTPIKALVAPPGDPFGIDP